MQPLHAAEDRSRRRNDVKVDVVEDRLQINFALLRVTDTVGSIGKRKPRTFDRPAQRKRCEAICHQRNTGWRQVDVDDRKAPAQALPINSGGNAGHLCRRQRVHMLITRLPDNRGDAALSNMNRAAVRLQLQRERRPANDSVSRDGIAFHTKRCFPMTYREFAIEPAAQCGYREIIRHKGHRLINSR
ncbi:MAG: hypothetical protein M3Q28_10485 [Pseudomonadota bacterium]|nr:hypothetical protein [Pseudomonadota bacterium]